MHPSLPIRLALLLALAAPTLRAQVNIVDEGSFTVSRRETRVGREEFSIRSTPTTSGPAVFVAQASAVYDDLRLFPALSARSDGVALSYQLETQRGTDVEERWSGTVGAGRVSARIARAGIDAVREFLVADGALLLDDDVFHQYHFVAMARRRRAATVAVIVPRRNQQVVLRLMDRGSQTIDVAGQAIVASVVACVSPDGVERVLWADADGRVLRVAIPSQGLVAQRDEPPRPLVPR